MHFKDNVCEGCNGKCCLFPFKSILTPDNWAEKQSGGRRRGIPNSTFIEKKTAGIGALGDIGCYSLDMVLNAIDYPKPLTVSGYKSNFLGTNPKYNNPADAARFDVDDFAAAFIRLEGGIILDFRIAWAMHIDTPGDTIIMGTEGALRIPSTECWIGTVGGPMKLYRDVAGKQIEVEIPLCPQEDSFGGLFYKKLRSFAMRGAHKKWHRSACAIEPDFLQPSDYRWHREVFRAWP